MARQGGLGKGLGALIPAPTSETIAAETGNGYREISVAEIRPNPYQPRSTFDDEALGALADSIRRLGFSSRYWFVPPRGALSSSPESADGERLREWGLRPFPR